MTVCSIDLRVGGELPHGVRNPRRDRVFVPGHLPGDRATAPDRRHVAVRGLAGRRGGRDRGPARGRWVTTVRMNLAFRDQAGRDHMTRY